MGIPKPVLWAAGLVLGVLFLWRIAYPAFDWHQKLTLIVETPAGEVTGSSVSSMRVTMGPTLFMDSPSIGVAFVGEATPS